MSQNSDKIFTVDLTKMKTAEAKTVTTCDYCGEPLGEHHPDYNHEDAFAVRLRKDPKTVGGYHWQEKQDHHFCGEACMAAHIKNRAYADDGYDDSMEASAKITSKERSTLKSSQFLYPDTRSYPIRNCQDVKNAIHAFGRGGNKDSYSTFIHKLHAKAKALGLEKCIPETTRKEHNLE